MATGAKKGGDMVLGSRHLFGIFILLVVIFGVIFTLGYLLGRSQYDAQIQAATTTAATHPDSVAAKQQASAHSAADAPPADPPSDWDFYHAGEPAKPVEPLPVQPKAVSAAGKPSAKAATEPAVAVASAPGARKTMTPAVLARSEKSANSPLIPRGATVLQVAALAREADALALAQALQKKKFPAFVLNPPPSGTDHFYRVQVGPYGDAPSSNSARQKLEAQGFKSIVKR